MKFKILSGVDCANALKIELKNEILKFNGTPKLMCFQVGANPASNSYIKNKEKGCNDVGIEFELVKFNTSISESSLIDKIQTSQANCDIDGFILQLPLPDHINEEEVSKHILPRFDVDGFSHVNLGMLMKGEQTFECATPKGIITLLNHYKINTKGQNVVVLGRSNIVGKPIANMMMQRDVNSTVTVCHRGTPQDVLLQHLKNADIIIAAIGVPMFVKPEMCKENVCLIDVGINRIKDDTKKSGFRLVGDVDFDAFKTIDFPCYITPVPGGIGPMTVFSLLQNTYISYKNNKQKNIL